MLGRQIGHIGDADQDLCQPFVDWNNNIHVGISYRECPRWGREHAPAYCMNSGRRLHLVLMDGYRHRRLSEATTMVLNILSMAHQDDCP